ncbi:MAG TPA: hypothetical protein DCP31_35975, partial [Cyanobacteria bacterium UBA8543]|nr:hypothetical protein [Cyanobacteria bacterium UBA8543]
MSRFPFPLKFSIPAILLLFGSALGLVSFQREISKSNLRAEQDISQQANFSASQLSALLEYQYRYEDGRGASLAISQIGAAPHIRLALLCNENDRVIFATRFELHHRSVSDTLVANKLSAIRTVRQTRSGEVRVSEDGQSIQAIYPVVLGSLPGDILPSRVGVLFFEYNLTALKAQAQRNALKRSLIYSGNLALLCTILWFFFDKILTLRVSKLVEASNSLAQGNLDIRANLQGSDELAQISKAFDRMAAEIQNSTDALHQNQKQLKQALYNLKQTQAQLIHSEKMSSLGQLVAGIAHEINNPVNFIHANLSYVNDYSLDLLKLIHLYQQHYPNPEVEIAEQTEEVELDFLAEDLPNILNSMKVGTERISKIVEGLRNFSRFDESDLKQVDIHEGIDSTLLILQNRLRGTRDSPQIEVIKDYGGLPKIECYAGQLNQVFMNIISNAIDTVNDLIFNKKDIQICQVQGQIRIQTEVKDSDWVR